jgi:hypothetical protein
MIPKSGYRFSEKIMLRQIRESGMTIRGKVIPPLACCFSPALLRDSLLPLGRDAEAGAVEGDSLIAPCSEKGLCYPDRFESLK